MKNRDSSKKSCVLLDHLLQLEIKINQFYMKKALCCLLTFVIIHYTQAQAPKITSFTPTNGTVGTSVTITGTSFNTTPAGNIVFFGATRATVTAATATSLTVTVPTSGTYGAITVLNTGTSLAAYSTQFFNPTFSPNKGSITTADYTAKVDFTTGPAPYLVAIGDLDGDGKPDLAVANSYSNTVSIFRNTSTSGSIAAGSFGAKVDFATGTQPYSVTIGDLDGDGKPDLAVANYSSFTLSVLRNADIVVLPVTLLRYEAKLTSTGTAQLNWSTATETNNSYFEVLRSADGINFTAVGKVTGGGNTTQEKRYNFTDLSPLAGTNYYQLVQYDKDGKKKVLGIRLVKVSHKVGSLIIYPNPSNGVVNLSFEANSFQKLELIDLAGKILLTRAIGRQERTMSLNISNLAAGIYNVKLTGNGKLARKQIIKE